jgi:hypothetical protein
MKNTPQRMASGEPWSADCAAKNANCGSAVFKDARVFE